ncbi:MAG TPA: glycosyltransferase 87 family protein [Polyangiales bacterium]|nr:glycosyltransferase 87 family protein [Polyangiales bacterium]
MTYPSQESAPARRWQFLALARELVGAPAWLGAVLVFFGAMCHLEVVNPARPLRMSIGVHGLVSALAGFALIGLGLARRRALTERAALAALWLLTCGFLGFSVLRFVISHVDHHSVIGVIRNLLRIGCVLGLVAVPAWLAGFRKSALALQLALFALLMTARALVLQASSDPRIDVFTLASEASMALWRGENPYAIETTNLYQGTQLDLGYSPGYNYFPALLIANALSYKLAGDVRALYVLAELVIALCLWRFSRALGWSRFAAWTFAVFWCSTTLSFQVIEKWNDALVLALVAATLTLLAERRWVLAGVAFGLAAASKQYVPLAALPLALFALRVAPPRLRLRAATATLLAAALPCLPFLVDRPEALLSRTLFHFAGTPFREESLSLLNWAHLTFGFGVDSAWIRVSPYLGLGLGLAASVLVALRCRADAPLGLNLQYLIVGWLCVWQGMFQFIKQSFLNYHYFFLGVSVFLLAALAQCRPNSAASR